MSKGKNFASKYLFGNIQWNYHDKLGEIAMSFGNRLKALIEASGTSIYQLAKKAQLDRTTIQRSIMGERLPSLAFVERLCDYLKVSPLERKELLELYTITKVGERTFYSRKYIKELIEEIASIHTRGQDTFIRKKTVVVDGHINGDSKVVTGYRVNNLLCDLLEDEIYNGDTAQIDLVVPFGYTYLFECLQGLYLEKSQKIRIRHGVKLSKHTHTLDNFDYNLKILRDVLPLAFTVGTGYQPYYYYGSTDSSKDIALVMPYFILTQKRLVTLSADFSTAILYNNQEIIATYRHHFERLILNTKPFINQLGDCGEMLNIYLDVYRETGGKFTHNIEPQPCFAKYYTHALIEKKLRQDVPHRDLVYRSLCQFYASYHDFDYVPMSLFSVEGLDYLVKTGIMADLPPRFALPFTPEERQYLLEALREDIARDSYFVRAINSSRFTISSVATIQLYGTRGIIFFSADDQGIISSYIDETSICEAFHDFFESLPNSNLIYSKEKTLAIIDGYLAQVSPEVG